MAKETAAPGAEQIGLLYDATLCIGCLECVRACKTDHDLPPEITPDLSATTYTVVEKKGEQYIRRLCMHCIDPTCVSVCPVAALTKEPGGQVTYDWSACMGCRYCVMACPFNIPRYEWHSYNPRVQKCDLCIHRTSKGGETACSWICPTGATQSGPREELLAIARKRIEDHPDRYVPHIYGEKEVGGTGVLVLSGVPFEEVGYDTDVIANAVPALTWKVMKKIPYVIVNGAIVRGGLAWIINRRKDVERNPEAVDDRKKPSGKEGGEE